MRIGGSALVLAVPDRDFGAKVPARTGAVNDGAGNRTIHPDRGVDASSNGWRAPGLRAI